jgi:hypothetical protein
VWWVWLKAEMWGLQSTESWDVLKVYKMVDVKDEK